MFQRHILIERTLHSEITHISFEGILNAVKAGQYGTVISFIKYVGCFRDTVYQDPLYLYTTIQGVSKRWTQFQTTIFHDGNILQLHKKLQTV
jgi:hypothetical protein